ncbi:MAG: hypothetical protein WBD27_07965 [Pyrinomonadaceae bacterium]
MNTLKQILFTFAVVIGLSIGILAQRNDDQKKPPPKEPPPTVNPRGEKPPPRNPPREEKPKKPGMAYSLVQAKEKFDIA